MGAVPWTGGEEGVPIPKNIEQNVVSEFSELSAAPHSLCNKAPLERMPKWPHDGARNTPETKPGSDSRQTPNTLKRNPVRGLRIHRGWEVASGRGVAPRHLDPEFFGIGRPSPRSATRAPDPTSPELGPRVASKRRPTRSSRATGRQTRNIAPPAVRKKGSNEKTNSWLTCKSARKTRATEPRARRPLRKRGGRVPARGCEPARRLTAKCYEAKGQPDQR